MDRGHNTVGAPRLAEDSRRLAGVRALMTDEPYSLDAPRRAVVLHSIQEVCEHKRWWLLAAHVRQSHVHIVVEAEQSPERVMTVFKAYCSRALAHAGFDPADRRRWARHGSTRYLWTPEEMTSAVHYVVSKQGDAMQVYVAAR